MTNKKKTAIKRPKRFLSVGPVTSREQTGPAPRKLNLRAAMKQQLRYAQHTLETKSIEVERLKAAIKAYGKAK